MNSNIETWWIETIANDKNRIIEMKEYIELKNISENKYISSSKYNELINKICYSLCADTPERREYILNNTIINNIINKIEINDSKYNEINDKSYINKERIAPTTSNGLCICIVLLCVTFIFNYFYIYWVIIIVGYIIWRKNEIKKFNPLDFKDYERKDV